MTPSSEHIRSAIAQQASEWFVTQSDGPSTEERVAFAAWLRESPRNVEEYLGIAAIAQALPAAVAEPNKSLEALIASARADIATSVRSLPAAERREPVTARRRPRSRYALPLAAAAALIIGFAALWDERDNWLGIPADYRTERRQQLVSALPDGSLVELNADSAVTVRYDVTARAAELTRGRALFTVEHGSPRPFRVSAGPATVVAVGTKFDIDLRADATIVTVVEGRVRVTAAPSAPDGTAGTATQAPYFVGAGEQVRVERGRIERLSAHVNLEASEAWRRGQLVFDHRALRDVAVDFNRYAPQPFEIEDPALGATEISGAFDSSRPESFARFLESLDGVVVERLPDRVRVSRAPAAGSAAEDTRR
jgi:transmembrane sensor